MGTTTLSTTSEAAVDGDGSRAARPVGGPAVVADPTGTPRADGAADISHMRVEIDAIDAELVRLIQRRTELSKAIGAMRASEGGPRIVYSREMKVLERFAALGSAGTDLGMLLLSMGRGRLGRR